MPSHAPELLRRTFHSARGGDKEAAARLVPLLYDELRALARSLLRRRPPGQTLQPTALVHEAYLRLAGTEDPGWEGKGHFFAAAARAMRDILVDEARRKAAQKRGGDRERVELEGVAASIEPPEEDILALEEALGRLEKGDPRKGQLVTLRYFAGLSMGEAAAVLGVSLSTVEREWRYARAWLYREVRGGGKRE